MTSDDLVLELAVRLRAKVRAIQPWPASAATRPDQLKPRNTIGFVRRGQSVSVGSTEWWVSVSTQVRTSIAFAANQPSPQYLMDVPVSVAGFGVQFYSRSDGWGVPSDWLKGNEVREGFASLALRPSETFRVASNVASLKVEPSLPDAFLSRLDEFLEIVDLLPTTLRAADRPVLPDAFGGLQVLVDRWALTDDDERTQAVAEADRDALAAMTGAVNPRLGEINRYLDSLAEPFPDGAIALQSLAEAAAEAIGELERRSN